MSSPSPLGRALRRSPRGGGFLNLIAIIATAVLTGGIGLGVLAIIDSSSCVVNVFWGCSGSDQGAQTQIGTLCVSDPNSCGDRNVGTLQTVQDVPSCVSGNSTSAARQQLCDKNGNCQGYTCQTCDKNGCNSSGTLTCPAGDTLDDSTGTCSRETCSAAVPSDASCSQTCNSIANICGQTNQGHLVNGTCNAVPPPASSCACASSANACGQTNSGFYDASGNSCNATPPSNASCPVPVIAAFSASPKVVAKQGRSTLTWDVTNATSLTIVGDNGFSYTTNVLKGSVDSGALDTTTTFTLTPMDGEGGPEANQSAKVIVDPNIKEI